MSRAASVYHTRHATDTTQTTHTHNNRFKVNTLAHARTMAGLTFFQLAYTSAFGVWLCGVRHALEALIVDDDEPSKLPRSPLQTRRDAEDRHARAWACIRHATAWVVLALGAAHVYGAEHDRLVAERTSARMQQPPFHCGTGSLEWDALSLPVRAMHTLYPTSAEQSCAEYLRRCERDVWPNPLVVFADVVIVVPMRWIDGVSDGVGHALHSFLSHFGLVQQWALLVVVACVVVALCLGRALLAPWVYSTRRFANAIGHQYFNMPPPPPPPLPPAFNTSRFLLNQRPAAAQCMLLGGGDSDASEQQQQQHVQMSYEPEW